MAVNVLNYCTGGATISIGGDLGAIKSPDGAVLTNTVELFEPNDAEQHTIASTAFITKESYQFSCTFLEPTHTVLPIAIGTDNTFAALALSVGDQQTTPVSRIIAVTGFGANAGVQYNRTLNIYKAVISSPPEYKISKTQLTECAVVFDCLYDEVTQDKVYNISDAVIP